MISFSAVDEELKRLRQLPERPRAIFATSRAHKDRKKRDERYLDDPRHGQSKPTNINRS